MKMTPGWLYRMSREELLMGQWQIIKVFGKCRFGRDMGVRVANRFGAIHFSKGIHNGFI